MPNSKGVRVAVIGAAGIGKHHAHWWSREGAQVCAIAGTRPASVEAARAALHDAFGIEPRGYVGIEELLEAEQPDIVDVCSPPERHFEHVRAALEANCHVLCEKPFLADPTLESAALIHQAEVLVALAREAGLRLELCVQFAAGAPALLRLRAQTGRTDPIRSLGVRIESPAKGRPPDPDRVWNDLGPHLISVSQICVPGGMLDWDSVEAEFQGYAARVRADFVRPGGEPVTCELHCANRTEDPPNIRRFSFDDYACEIRGAKDEHGIYCAEIVTRDGVYHEDDFMRTLIREYLAGRSVADGAFAVENLRVLSGVSAIVNGARPADIMPDRP